MLAKSEEQFDMRALLRLGSWGGSALIALSFAVIAARSDIGTQRMAMAYTQTQVARADSGQFADRAELTQQTRRLSESMRSLASDRDRLLARVTVLERNLEDVTGSITRTSPAGVAAPKPSGNSNIALTGPTIMSTIGAPAQRGAFSGEGHAPLPGRGAATEPGANATASESVATVTEFGIDIGGGATMQALRDLWSAAKGNHGATLKGLRPVIGIREGAKPGAIDLRLIAGPLSNANAAAKLCAAMAAGGWACRPAPFDGQKLAVR